MYYRTRLERIHELAHLTGVDDVTPNKLMPPVLFDRSKILPIAGIGELVEGYRRSARMYPAQNEIRADKPGAAGHNHYIIHALISSLQAAILRYRGMHPALASMKKGAEMRLPVRKSKLRRNQQCTTLVALIPRVAPRESTTNCDSATMRR